MLGYVGNSSSARTQRTREQICLYSNMYRYVCEGSSCVCMPDVRKSRPIKTLRQDAQRSDSTPGGSFRRVVHGPTVSCAEAVTTDAGCVQPLCNVTRCHPVIMTA